MSLYRSILLVDDDVEDQEIFMDAVKETDPSVYCFCAKDGDEALKLINDNSVVRPDLIFIDINMPKQNGKQLLQEVKSQEAGRDIPVIMYSTFFSPLDIQEIEAAGAAHHMVKASGFRDLCDNLQKVLTKPW